mgnify:CR=1 FL=1
MKNINGEILLYEYYEEWVEIYKCGAIREVTLMKYKNTLRWMKQLAPKLKLKDITRTDYQKLINDYAHSHERQTTMDFHHQLKAKTCARARKSH